MQTRAAPRHPAQRAAFADRRVIAIGNTLRELPHPALLGVIRDALAGPWALADEDIERSVGRHASTEVRAAARVVADHAFSVYGERDREQRGRLIGALVERIVWELVTERADRVEREVAVRLLASSRSGRTWSKPKEFVIDADPFEAYECKFSPDRVDQADLDELMDIDEAAEAEGVGGGSTIVVLASERALLNAQRRLGWRLDGRKVRFATTADLTDLINSPAHRRIA